MRHFGYLVAAALLISCSSSPLRHEQAKELETNTEFDKAVRIEGTEIHTSGADAAAMPVENNVTTPAPKATPSEIEKNLIPEKKTDVKTAATKQAEKKKPAKKIQKAKKVEEPAAPLRRQPEIEDDAGFQGRRPLKDPFRVGEEVIHEVSYFGTNAGTLKLKVEPMVTVNGRKAYNFVTEIKTSSMYSRLYSVDDRVETFVDFDTLVPRVFALHVKESSQLREARMLFDEKTNRATFWEKKVTEKKGVEEKKLAWDILPYSQNVFSAVFYMRNFQWEPGKEVAFRVADDEQNLIFSGKCLRREKISTDIGEKNALVIQPKIILKGKFKPVGDILIWLSDDEYKYPLRIESEIKIGTLVSEVIKIVPGQK